MALRAISIVATYQQHWSPQHHHAAYLEMAYFTTIHEHNEANYEVEKYVKNISNLQNTNHVNSVYTQFVYRRSFDNTVSCV